jgi:hypothetical protein
LFYQRSSKPLAFDTEGFQAAMPLKSWQIALVGFEQASFAAFCVYVLAASHTSFGGDRAPFWSHRTFQMTIMIVSSASWLALVWAIPKRQIFFVTVVGSAAQFTIACDTVWKCPRVHFFVWKSFGVMAIFALAAIMRKMGARLVDSKTKVDQLTPFQKVLLAASAVVTVLTLAFPDFPVVSAAVEMCVFVLVVLSVWWDFAKFMLASSEVFSVLASHHGSKQKCENPGQVGVPQSLQAKRNSERKSVMRRAKHLKRVMMVLLLLVHIFFLIYVLISSFWRINLPGICDARSVDKDARRVVETVRFYFCDVCQVILVMNTWANIYVFTGAARRKKKQGTTQAAVAPPPTGYANATSVALTPTQS